MTPQITAISFDKADAARIPEGAEQVAALEGVSEVYPVTGQIDLIAIVRVRNHDDVATVVADKLNKIAAVTETHIALGVLSARPRAGVLPRTRLIYRTPRVDG